MTTRGTYSPLPQPDQSIAAWSGVRLSAKIRTRPDYWTCTGYWTDIETPMGEDNGAPTERRGPYNPRKGRRLGPPLSIGGMNRYRKELSEAEREQCKALRASGMGWTAIAKRMGVGRTTVRRIVLGREVTG